MALETEKREIIKRIEETQEEWVIRSIQKLLNIPTDDIVAYTTEGKPLSKADFIKEVLEASADAKAGNFTTHEDLKEEIKGW